MLKIGITGNIATGKSTVEKMISDEDFPIIDADFIAHELLKRDDIKAQIADAFSDYDIIDNDEISRPKLGKIVFADENERKKLESIMHPMIRNEIKKFFELKKIEEEKIVFVSIPLLFEAKFEDLFDKIILVYTDDKIRIKRLMARNNLTEDLAKNRMLIQMEQDKKKPKSAFILFNNGTIDELKIQLNEVLSHLV